MLDMDAPHPTDEQKSAYAALEQQESRQATMTVHDWTRRKQVLPYCYVADYGTYTDGEDEIAAQFLRGDDHRALLRLWDAMEARGGQGVIYFPAPSSDEAEAKSNADSDNGSGADDDAGSDDGMGSDNDEDSADDDSNADNGTDSGEESDD
jgi:hypothetical protein